MHRMWFDIRLFNLLNPIRSFIFRDYSYFAFEIACMLGLAFHIVENFFITHHPKNIPRIIENIYFRISNKLKQQINFRKNMFLCHAHSKM